VGRVKVKERRKRDVSKDGMREMEREREGSRRGRVKRKC